MGLLVARTVALPSVPPPLESDSESSTGMTGLAGGILAFPFFEFFLGHFPFVEIVFSFSLVALMALTAAISTGLSWLGFFSATWQ